MPPMNLSEKIEHYNSQIDSISRSILEQMKEGKSDWQMPWHKGVPEAWNPVTGKFYGGNNLLLLWQACIKNKYPTNHWATFKQWQRKGSGVKVKTGEKGTLIMFAIPKGTPDEEDESSEEQKHFDFINEEEKENAREDFFFRYYWVFNAAQVQGYDKSQPDLFSEKISDLDRLKKFIKNTGAEIKKGGNRAFYSIVEDFIQMPEIARFKAAKGNGSQTLNYYSTLLHEIIHWTGHESRCGRNFGFKFGDNAYAFEELVAELGGAILTSQFNIQPFPREDHAVYWNSWIKVLETEFSYFTEALELARTAIYWLYQETDILPFDLKPQYGRSFSESRVKNWEVLVN